MKKLLILTAALFTLIFVLTLSATAETVPFEDDYANESDVVFASINGIRPFLSDLQNTDPIEDACYWIADYAEKHNIKYVSFLGDMSSKTNYWYELVVTQQKKSVNELYSLNKTDTEWIKEFVKLRDIGTVLTDAGIPYGISIGKTDYTSNGFTRDNHVALQFMIDDFSGIKADVTVEAYDNNNFATIVNQDGKEYVVYQLEIYPQQAVMNWFEKTNANHLDKRAFVFTTSFVDAKGEMYRAFDPTLSTYGAAKDKGNSTLNTNMVNIGKPFDGNQLWNHFLSKHDNIVMIMSANATPKTDIVVSKFENANGHEVVSVLSNLISGYANMGVYPVLIKFSEEEKTLDLRYAVPYDNKVGGYIKESQITVSLDKMAPLPEPSAESLMPKVPAQYNGENTKYINGYAGNLFKPNANMTRAEASTIFARLLTGSTTLPTGNTTRFTDVKAGDWYYDAIAYMDTNGFYKSNTADLYRPNDPITRAEFVELAYLASTLSATESIVFSDVSQDHPYYDAIIAAAASGLVNGYEDNTFRPDGKITRAEVVTVINRMLSLVCNNETILRDKLSNIFSDISGHWAEYQILMASNDKVKSQSYYDSSNALNETPSAITFKNNLIEVYINKKNGKIFDIIYLPTGESVVGTSTNPWFAFLTSKTGAVISPTSVELVDGRLKFNFRGGYAAYFIINAYDNFFSVEVDSNISKDLWKINFGCLPYSYKPSYEEGSFRASAVSMDTRAMVSVSPGGYKSTAPYATAITTVGRDVMGSKVGICFSTYETHRDILKEIVDEIDIKKGITSTKGGPYALDAEDVFYDYVIINGFNGSNAENHAKLAKDFDVEILDLHFGSSTFTTGDFNFVGARTEEEKEAGTFIDGKTFKERVLDPISEYGREIAIHSYAQGVSDGARSIVTDPKFQKELHYGNTYTLRGDLSVFRTTVKTNEDASNYKVDALPMPYTSTYGTSQYLLIDEEIIRVLPSKGTTSGFMQVLRGQLGTKATTHEDGAEIRHLSCWFGVFHSIPGSDLFWHIADQHAKAYNDTGAVMIYLDCIDVMTKLAPSAEQTYYQTEFVRRIIEQCNTVPLIESANNGAWMWNTAGKKGALDVVGRAIKRHKKSHYEVLGTDAHEVFLSLNLGWFNFDGGTNTQYRNVYEKLLFHDDLDYMGSVSIASDFAMTPRSLNNNPEQRYGDNYRYYGVYTRLRKSGYFAPEVKEEIRNGKYEYRVFQMKDGSYAFREMHYVEKKVDLTSTAAERTGSATNPFDAHTPFIRIEQKFSTLKKGEGKTLLKLDETLDISKVTGTKTISNTDIASKRCLAVKVYGNGQNGAILISLKGSGSTGRYDYFIPTSHTGWKEFYLMEIDNAEFYSPYNFAQADNSWNKYETYSSGVNRDKINTIIIGTSQNVTGVKIDDIVAYEHADAPAKNPSVTIGAKTITFDAELHSGDFIEYYPDTNKAYLNYFENVYNAETGEWEKNVAHVKEITHSGSVTVPAGAFSFEYNAKAMTDAPIRARVKLGLQGKILENPDTWVAPEVDMGNATLDIVTR